MAIDMKALKSTTFGNPETKLNVKRSWLTEVHKLLEEGERAKREHAALEQQVKDHNEKFDNPETKKGWGKYNDGMDRIFGKDGAFDNLFGKH